MIIIILTGGLRRRQIVTTQPTQRMKGNRVISTPLKIMKIMADVSSLGSNETIVEDERVLCTVKVRTSIIII